MKKPSLICVPIVSTVKVPQEFPYNYELLKSYEMFMQCYDLSTNLILNMVYDIFVCVHLCIDCLPIWAPFFVLDIMRTGWVSARQRSLRYMPSVADHDLQFYFSFLCTMGTIRVLYLADDERISLSFAL
jgi:hypothetical protein